MKENTWIMIHNLLVDEIKETQNQQQKERLNAIRDLVDELRFDTWKEELFKGD